jgi:hypothetical protein
MSTSEFLLAGQIMAFSVIIKGVSKGKRHVLFEVEPPWWDTDQLLDRVQFDASNETGSYFDYDADVSLEEMRGIHESFRNAATMGVYACDEWQERIQPMIRELDEALYERPDDYAYFHINIFEWESGFGD